MDINIPPSRSTCTLRVLICHATTALDHPKLDVTANNKHPEPVIRGSRRKRSMEKGIRKCGGSDS
eukprot:112974-Amphidinium_carterae.3